MKTNKKSGYTQKDLDFATGGAISGGLGMAGTGASIGSAFGPIGMGVGAGVGAIYGAITGSKAEDDAKKRMQMERALQTAAANPVTAKEGYTVNYVVGGPMQQVGTPIINENINNGNPTDSIPTDQAGNPSIMSGQPPVANTDDGEVIWNGFVFSKKLGFADKAKAIMKQYKLRLGDDFKKKDDPSMEAMNMRLSKLAQQQEEYKLEHGIKDELPNMDDGGVIKPLTGSVDVLNEYAKNKYANRDMFGNILDNRRKLNETFGYQRQPESTSIPTLPIKEINNAIARPDIITTKGPDKINTMPLIGGSIPIKKTSTLVGKGSDQFNYPKNEISYQGDGIIPKGTILPTPVPTPALKMEPIKATSIAPSKPTNLKAASAGINKNDTSPQAGFDSLLGDMKNDMLPGIIGQGLSLAGQTAKLIFDKPQMVAPITTNPRLVDLSGDKLALKNQSEIGKAQINRATRGNMAAMIEATGQADSRLNAGLSELSTKQATANTGILNDAAKFNAEAIGKAQEINAQEKAGYNAQVMQTLRDAGNMATGISKDFGNARNAAMMIINSGDRYIFDPKTKKIVLNPDYKPSKKEG